MFADIKLSRRWKLYLLKINKPSGRKRGKMVGPSLTGGREIEMKEAREKNARAVGARATLAIWLDATFSCIIYGRALEDPVSKARRRSLIRQFGFSTRTRDKERNCRDHCRVNCTRPSPEHPISKRNFQSLRGSKQSTNRRASALQD